MVFVGRCQTVLITCEQVFDFGLCQHFRGVGLRVFWTHGTTDDVDDRAPKRVTGCLEFLAPLRSKFSALREFFPCADLRFMEARIPNGIVPEVIRVPRFAAG